MAKHPQQPLSHNYHTMKHKSSFIQAKTFTSSHSLVSWQEEEAEPYAEKPEDTLINENDYYMPPEPQHITKPKHPKQ